MYLYGGGSFDWFVARRIPIALFASMTIRLHPDGFDRLDAYASLHRSLSHYTLVLAYGPEGLVLGLWSILNMQLYFWNVGRLDAYAPKYADHYRLVCSLSQAINLRYEQCG